MALGQAVETDTGRPLSRKVARAIGQAVETDTATAAIATSFTTVAVSGTFLTPADAPARGWLRFTPTEQMTNGALIVATAPVVATLDGSGAVALSLVANDDADTATVSGDTAQYLVEELLVGQRPRSYRITIPYTSDTLDLADVIPE